MGQRPVSRRRMLSATVGAAAAVATTAWTRPAPATAQADGSAPPGIGQLPTQYVLPGDRAFPTGHAYDARTGHIYVGSAADGTLYRGHLTKPALRPWSADRIDGRSTTSGMAIDSAGRLLVGGADTGTLRVYDTQGGALLALLRGVDGGFVNEIAVAPDGSAYATDSFRPVVYRLADTSSGWHLQRWLDITTTPIEWIEDRHNLNGITCVGGHLVTVNSSTGQLWRIDRRTRQVRQVDLGGHQLPNGDGLAFRNGQLYVVQGNINNIPGLTPQVTVITMSPDLSHGRYTSRLLAPGGFHHPSSISLARDRALVVNSQYNRWINGLPPEVLPFTLSAVPLNLALSRVALSGS
ncbi:SMP-30/gluconolactonase/LRE family protein [Streptomyces hawaiiensis]|uniref:SMP-30/gluconolactonase/LRE family protein n=1 Tax=Streptomyces hawaiiensis TaxID=67305 RepID=UPI003660D7FD